MKALKIALAVLLVAVVAAIVWKFEQVRSFQRADQEIVNKVDEALGRALATDAELTQRMGPFTRLAGSGHHRPKYAWQLLDRIEMSRQAVFERGRIQLNVFVGCSESRDLGKWFVGHIAWTPPPQSGEDGDILDVSVAIDRRPVANMSNESDGEPQEPSPPRILTKVALSGDTGTVFLGRQLDKVEVWGRIARKHLRDIEGRYGEIRALAPAADSSPLVIDTDNRLIVVDSATGKFTKSIPGGHLVRGPRTAISADGQIMVSGSFRMTKDGFEMAGVDDFSTNKSALLAVKRPTPRSGGSSYTPMAESIFLSPDGRHAVLALEAQPQTRMVQHWDLSSLTLKWERDCSGSLPRSAHPRVRFLKGPHLGKLCVYADHSVTPDAPEIWNLDSGELETSLEKPDRALWSEFGRSSAGFSQFEPESSLALSPDGQLLASGHRFGRVLIWHLPTGRIAGLITNGDWNLEGSLANDEGAQWVDPPPPKGGYKGINLRAPGRGERLAAIGFDAGNRLIGVSLFPRVAWVWNAEPGWLREASGSRAGALSR